MKILEVIWLCTWNNYLFLNHAFKRCFWICLYRACKHVFRFLFAFIGIYLHKYYVNICIEWNKSVYLIHRTGLCIKGVAVFYFTMKIYSYFKSFRSRKRELNKKNSLFGGIKNVSHFVMAMHKSVSTQGVRHKAWNDWFWALFSEYLSIGIWSEWLHLLEYWNGLLG